MYILNNLFILLDKNTNGYNFESIEIITLISIVCGIFVIISKNPIVSVLFLIGLFLCISGYLMLLGLNFIGLSYLLVYVGAVSILFLFILMLINIRISELQSDTNNSLALSLILGVLFYSYLYILLPSDIIKIDNTFLNTVFSSNEPFYGNSNIWDNNLIENSHIVSIGNILYTNYFIWLIITSIVLLLAMVGTIIITIRS